MGYYGGTTVLGANSYEMGRSVSGIGDINGDGTNDFLITSSEYATEIGPGDVGGAAYVVFGSANGTLPATIDVDLLDGTNGFKVTGRVPESTAADGYFYFHYGFGSDAVGLGDFNGDGVDDVALSVRRFGYDYNPYDDDSAYDTDAMVSAFVLFGQNTEENGDFEADVILNDGSGTEGLLIVGEMGGTNIITSGDFNGDGQADLLITSVTGFYGSYGTTAYASEGFVVFGDDQGFIDDVVDLKDLDGQNGFRMDFGTVDSVINQPDGGGFYGEFVGTGGAIFLGDVDGDGFDEIGIQTAQTSVYTGRSAELPPGGDYAYYYNGYYYYNVAEITRDLYILFGEGTTSTAPAVVDPASGSEVFWDSLDSDEPATGQVFNVPYSYYTVSDVGDVNGDGFDDVGIGVTNRVLRSEFNPEDSDDQDAVGTVGIIFGGPDGVDEDGTGPQDGLNPNVSLASRDSSGNLIFQPDVLIVNSNGLREDFGGRVVGLDDVNGDGIDDFAIGASRAYNDAGETYWGAIHVIYGRDENSGDTFPVILDLDELSSAESDATGFLITNGLQRGTDFGSAIAAAGDINGDGFGDILLGAPYYDEPGGTVMSTGKGFVLFGGPENIAAVDAADGADDNVLDVASLGVVVSMGETGTADDDDIILGGSDVVERPDNDGIDILKAGDAANDDLVNGLGGDDLIGGGGGNDTLNGGDGNDTIHGGDDDDSIIGGIGDDLLLGEFGDDTILGNDGNDDIFGGLGASTVDGGTGQDDINTSSGSDSVNGGDDADTITTRGGNDTVHGDGGDDTISTGTGMDDITGGLGDDDIAAGRDGDIVQGGDGADTIDGGTGDDDLAGDDHDDVLQGRQGMDTLDGGSGSDKLYGNKDNDVLDGGIGDDTVSGGGDDDMLAGGDGSDLLRGNSGEDTLEGGAGFDRLNGGTGSDTFVFLDVDDESGDGFDVIQDFEAGVDVIDLSNYPVTVEELLITVTTNGLRFGTEGDDIAIVSGVSDLSLDDIIFAEPPPDVVLL